MSQPVRRTPVVPYEVCAYRTRTGEVRRWVPCARLPDWEQGLNLMGSWRAYPTLSRTDLPKDELNTIVEPWDWSWAICQGQKIWQAGPVLGENYSEGGGVTQIYGVGIWQLLADKRLLVSPTRASVSDIKAFDADVPFGTGTFSTVGATIPAANKNLNLRGIAKKLVEIAIGISTDARYVPIVLPTDGVFAGTSARDFPGFDLATFRRLYELTQVDGGPEIMLVPEFTTTARKFVQHRLILGSPRLGQLGKPHVWAYNRGLTKASFVLDGVEKTNQAWERGSGQERNTVLGYAEDQTIVNLYGGTVLQTVGTSHSQDGDAETLNGYALQNLNTNRSGALTLSVEVSMNGMDGTGELTESPDLSAVTPGDTAILRFKNHLRLPDGDYSVRIARMSGSGLNRAKLDVKSL
jgi:hypothetical protein